MASYKIAPIPEDSIAIETIEAGIEATSAFDSDAELKSGMLPQTFTEGADGLYWAEYGRETYYDRMTLEGPVETKRAERSEVIFLQNGYIAIKKRPQKVEEKILATLTTVLDNEVKLETIGFDEDDLRTIIEESDRVERVDVSPESIDGPDHISAQDRGDLRNTDWYDQHVADPFEKVRVELPNRRVNVDVGFDDTGRITLFKRELDMAIQAEVMQQLTDEIIDPYRTPRDFQGTLGGYE